MARRGDNFQIRLDDRKLQRLIRSTPGDADDGVEALAREGERIVKESFNTSPPGRTYGRHVASQPGYPPNIDSGKLLNAIAVRKPRSLQRIVHTGDAEHAAPLEFGTSKMAARPFMRPMIVALRPLVVGIMRRFVARP